MEMFGILISVIGFIIPILVVGVVIYIIVIVSKNKNDNVKFKLSSKTLLQIYLYVISFLTLGICIIGATVALRAAVSFQMDIPFTYTLQKANDMKEAVPVFEDDILVEETQEKCYQSDPVTYYDTEFCFDSNQRKTDLINGITLFVSMAILFLIHQYALSKIKEERKIEWLKKIYIFASLILYSIVSIIAIPTAIYQVINYLLFEMDTSMYSTPPAPAFAIAVVLVGVPLWIYFFKETVKLKED